MVVDGSPGGIELHVFLHLPLSRMGSRHGQICFYDVGFDETGKVLALKANFYNDGMSRGQATLHVPWQAAFFFFFFFEVIDRAWGQGLMLFTMWDTSVQVGTATTPRWTR
jgi:hypothetical protein